MKKVLVSQEGYVMQIEEPEDQFDIYNGPDATFQWVDAPDNVSLFWTLEYSPTQQRMVWVEREYPHPNREMQRKVAYGDVGAQLDMLYHDLKSGVPLTEGAWVNHIELVKNSIPAPETSVEEDLSPEEQAAMDEIREPAVDQPMKFSSDEMPAWKRFPGWWGYNNGGGE